MKKRRPQNKAEEAAVRRLQDRFSRIGQDLARASWIASVAPAAKFDIALIQLIIRVERDAAELKQYCEERMI